MLHCAPCMFHDASCTLLVLFSSQMCPSFHCHIINFHIISLATFSPTRGLQPNLLLFRGDLLIRTFMTSIVVPIPRIFLNLLQGFRLQTNPTVNHLIGAIPIHPIPFDDLKKEIFDHFLILSYCGTTTLNHLAKNDLVDVKQLCIDWYLPHQTSMIIRRLCEIRIQQLSPQNWYFSQTFTFQHINRRQHQIWRYHRNVVNESALEDMIIVEDD
jgi:hypothetical protein